MALRKLQRRSDLKRAIDILEMDIAFATPNTNVVSAANMLLRSSKWRVPVVDHKKHLFGVYTSMDIIVKYYEKKTNDFTVNDFMKKQVIYSFFDEDIVDVINKMKMFSVGGLPVIDDQGKVIGLIEKNDIIYRLPFDEDLTAMDIMTEKPFFVKKIEKNDNINVLKIFGKTSFKRFPVVDDEMRLVGLLHVNNLLKILSSVNFVWDEFMKLNSNTIVSSNYTSVAEDEPISNILRLMKMRGTDTILVLDEEKKLTGIITDSDIMNKAILV